MEPAAALLDVRFPGAIALDEVLQQCADLDAIVRAFGSHFLIAAVAERSPVATHRTSAFEDMPHTNTSGTQLCVIPLRPRSADRPTATLGRAASNDVVIIDPTVSKLHAFFRIDERGVEVTDAGSHNGTLVDLRPAPVRGEQTPPSLANGATLRVGAVELTYVDAAGLAEMLRLLKGFRPVG